MTILNLCCGPNKPKEHYGIDILKFPCVDRVWDLNEGIPLEDDSCECVIANDALEHIRDARMIMCEIWRVLKDCGWLYVKIPSTDGRGAFQDMTHVSFWNENSFRYWINNQEWMDYYRGPCLFSCNSLHTTEFSEDHVCHVIFEGKAIKNDEWLRSLYGRLPDAMLDGPWRKSVSGRKYLRSNSLQDEQSKTGDNK
jgi:SAM-dependent methyltransferase